MKIALINPASDFLLDPCSQPPLGLWYLISSLQQAGFETCFADRSFDDPLPDADVYGITGTTPQSADMKVLVDMLRPLGKPLVAGGPHASLFPEQMLDMGFDLVITGEAERTFPQALKMGTRGIVRSPRIKELGNIPHPWRDAMRRYTYRINDYPATTMLTSRGCPFSCAHCCKAILGKQTVLRPITDVISELEELRYIHHYKAVMFFDDIFGVNNRHTLELCSLMEPLDMTFRGFRRSPLITDENAEAMKRAGFVELGIGLESGSAQILKNIHKGETPEEQMRGIKIAKRHNLRVKTFCIVGLPGETPDTIAETARFLEEAQPDDMDFSILSVFAGSDIWDNPSGYDVSWDRGKSQFYKGKPGEYATSTATSAMSSDELLKARDALEQRFKPQLWQPDNQQCRLLKLGVS